MLRPSRIAPNKRVTNLLFSAERCGLTRSLKRRSADGTPPARGWRSAVVARLANVSPPESM